MRCFVYTHVLHAEKLLHVDLIAAKHRFVCELRLQFAEATAATEKAEGGDGPPRIRPCVVCPSGFFSDLEEVLEMALAGRIYVFGEAKELGGNLFMSSHYLFTCMSH